jgi:hypothetical protein
MPDLPDWTFASGIIPRTLYVPIQDSYFLSYSTSISPSTRKTIKILEGFGPGMPWIPIGYMFAINYAVVTADQNSLITLEIGEENPQNEGNPEWIARKYGYGEAEFSLGLNYVFFPYTRPVYAITNFLDEEIHVVLIVNGILERL